MAKCKLCKAEIADGARYCKNCMEKEKDKSKEAYLDSLLNSVLNTPTPKADKTSDRKDLKNSKNTTDDKLFMNAPDEKDVEDFDNFNIMEDLEDADAFIDMEHLDELEEPILISEEELFEPSLEEDMQEEKVETTIVNSMDKDKQVEDTTMSKDALGDKLNNILDSNVQLNEIDEFEDEDYEDPTLYALLSELDMSEMDEEKSLEDTDNLSGMDSTVPSEAQADLDLSYDKDTSQEDSIDGDLLSLLNQISADDPLAAEAFAINDLLNGRKPSQDENDSSSTNDVGDVFSEALTAVSSLKDDNLSEEEALSSILGQEVASDSGQGDPLITNEEKKKRKKEKLKKLLRESDEDSIEKKAQVKGKKKGLLARIFANTSEKKEKDNATDSMDETVVENADSSPEKIAPKKKSKVKKAAKVKKSKNKALTNEEDSDPKKTPAKKSVNKNTSKKESRKTKKAAKTKAKVVKKVVDEVEANEGHINPVAVAIVLMIFASLALFTISGTKAFAYSKSIQNATYYFDIQKYTEAYDEVYGMEIQDEDMEIYNKIQTVMFVNKQLNSYNNYYAIGKYPEALDSLLKGLSRYEKYIELATLLGVDSDLNYVRGQILSELKNKFNLNEEEAMHMIKIGNETEYSLQVYDVVIEKMIK